MRFVEFPGSRSKIVSSTLAVPRGNVQLGGILEDLKMEFVIPPSTKGDTDNKIPMVLKARAESSPTSPNIKEEPEDKMDGESDETDSPRMELFWMSDESDATPRMDELHPSTRLLEPVLKQLLSIFEQWKKQYLDQRQHTLHADDNATSSKSGDGGYGERSSKKRKHDNRKGKGQEQDNFSDECILTNKASKKIKTKGYPRKLACPFCKKDSTGSIRYRTCYRYTLARVRDVKQHLRRCHRLPIYCSICMTIFEDEADRDAHTRVRSCVDRISTPIEGVSEAQWRQLEKRVPPKMTEEEQWYTVFEILFPGQQRPQSAYIDHDLSEELCAFEDFSEREGPKIISDRLQAAGFVHEGESDALLHSTIAEGIQTIAEHWSILQATERSENYEENGDDRNKRASGAQPLVGQELEVHATHSILGANTPLQNQAQIESRAGSSAIADVLHQSENYVGGFEQWPLAIPNPFDEEDFMREFTNAGGTY